LHIRNAPSAVFHLLMTIVTVNANSVDLGVTQAMECKFYKYIA